jgi:hypothetical protein
MNYEYGLACFFSSSLGAIFGNMLIKRIVKNTKKTSILIYVLGIISLLSTIVIPIQSIFDIIKDIDEGKNIFKFNYPC